MNVLQKRQLKSAIQSLRDLSIACEKEKQKQKFRLFNHLDISHQKQTNTTLDSKKTISFGLLLKTNLIRVKKKFKSPLSLYVFH